MAGETNMACIVCGAATSAGLAAWHAACPSCDYQSGALAAAINDEQAHGVVNEADRELGLKALRQQNFEVIAGYASRHARPGAKTLLDVGSAHGWFLEAARGRFDVLGIEPDAAVGARAAARGLPVRRGFFPDVLEAGETFDVIVFNDVIEHIPDIRGALAACRERLNPDGILILNLPNCRGFFYRLAKLLARLGWHAPFDRLWQKGLPSPHVHYFNRSNLTALVEQQGFERVADAELPSLRAGGLLQRIRAGNVGAAALYAQYLAVLCAIPALRLFPSDIIVCVYRKPAAAA
jgi:2-polyprenyl-3-methyl-5-hydroxy-6-metoxy-1,4-benzoquinol methylase